jgi:transposase-like protein/uncharacterized protein (DUF433 family)
MRHEESRARNKEIIDLYKTGEWSIQSLADHYKLSVSYIKYLVAFKAPTLTRMEARNAQIVEFYKQEQDVLKTAEHFNLSTFSIRSILHRNGGELVRNAERSQKRGPTERHLNMIEMYQSGKTLQEVGEHFGITRERVRQILHKFDVTSRKAGRTPKPIGEDVQRAIIDLYQGGNSQIQIGKFFPEIPFHAIRLILEGSGVEIRTGKEIWAEHPKRVPDDVREAVLKMYQEGATTVAVAERFGVAQSWVHKFIKQQGILRPTKFFAGRVTTVIPEEQKKLIIKRYLSGLNCSQVAQEMGMNQGTIAGIIRRYGLMRPRGKVTVEA